MRSPGSVRPATTAWLVPVDGSGSAFGSTYGEVLAVVHLTPKAVSFRRAASPVPREFGWQRG